MIENGRFCAPNSASCRSGSSAASSSSVGCSGSSAYGQKRSSGRYFGGSAVIGLIAGGADSIPFRRCLTFASIPSIELLRQRPAVRALEARFGADATVDALRAAAADVRAAIAGGDAGLSTEAAVVARIEAAAARHASMTHFGRRCSR